MKRNGRYYFIVISVTAIILPLILSFLCRWCVIVLAESTNLTWFSKVSIGDFLGFFAVIAGFIFTSWIYYRGEREKQQNKELVEKNKQAEIRRPSPCFDIEFISSALDETLTLHICNMGRQTLRCISIYEYVILQALSPGEKADISFFKDGTEWFDKNHNSVYIEIKLGENGIVGNFALLAYDKAGRLWECDYEIENGKPISQIKGIID